MIQSFSKYRVE